MRSPVICVVAVLAAVLLNVSTVDAASILFVSDASQDDVNIPAVLTGDGHLVTVVTGDHNSVTETNAVLGGGGLAAYDAIFWNASGGTGSGGVHVLATATNLASYVSAGGSLFVTGYDSVVSPDDPNLISLLGASGGADSASAAALNPVINVANSLTTGVVDIRGVIPSGGHSDTDVLIGPGVGTVGVVSSTGGYEWTLRDLGAGQIAYVSNGASGSNSEHASWLDTSAGGAGAYNAAVRNFAASAVVIPLPGSVWMGLAMFGVLGVAQRLRRK